MNAQMDYRNLPPRLAQGQAGVFTVAAQLLLRGINPCFPGVDRGADIITDRGIRIQVKSGYLRKNISGGSYHFCLSSGITMYTAGNGYKKSQRTPRMFSKECDFFVLWGIEGNKFWIVPSEMMDGRSSVVVGDSDEPWTKAEHDLILQDKKDGMSGREIARKYGISPTVVSRVILGKRSDEALSRTRYIKKIMQLNGRWELIVDREKTIAGAVEIAELETLVSK